MVATTVFRKMNGNDSVSIDDKVSSALEDTIDKTQPVWGEVGLGWVLVNFSNEDWCGVVDGSVGNGSETWQSFGLVCPGLRQLKHNFLIFTIFV